jgi:hypothetical protein
VKFHAGFYAALTTLTFSRIAQGDAEELDPLWAGYKARAARNAATATLYAFIGYFLSILLTTLPEHFVYRRMLKEKAPSLLDCALINAVTNPWIIWGFTTFTKNKFWSDPDQWTSCILLLLVIEAAAIIVEGILIARVSVIPFVRALKVSFTANLVSLLFGGYIMLVAFAIFGVPEHR